MHFLKSHSQSECCWNYLTGLVSREELEEESRTKAINEVLALAKDALSSNILAWGFLLQVGSQSMKK